MKGKGKINHTNLQVPGKKRIRELQEYPKVQKRLLEITEFSEPQNVVFLYFIIIDKCIRNHHHHHHHPPPWNNAWSIALRESTTDGPSHSPVTTLRLPRIY